MGKHFWGQKQATTHNFLVGNIECNTERGFKNQLYIELGVSRLFKGRIAPFPDESNPYLQKQQYHNFISFFPIRILD